MQIDRLFQIVQILLNKKKVTARELAQRFQVSERTIYRDIDTLSLNGIPVYTVKGKGGGISLVEDYTMDRSALTETERNDILMGLQTLKATQAQDVEEILGKFRDLFRQNQPDWIRVDFSHWGNDPREREKFETVKKGLTSSSAIEFTYFDAYARQTHRRVFPLQLVFKEKAWYLVAYCCNKQENRFFKLLRMKDVSRLDEKFDAGQYPMNDFLKAPIYEKGQVFKFWISKDIRYRIYDEFGKEQVTPLEDGNFEVLYYGREDDWLYSFILSYGEHLKVLAPEGLREAIHEKIEKDVVSLFII